jgi:hypothetical protein
VLDPYYFIGYSPEQMSLRGLSERQAEVNVRGIHIIVELCSSNQFASFDRVLAVLLQRYGVYSFQQLGCGLLSDIPVFALLIDLCTKVSNYYFVL